MLQNLRALGRLGALLALLLAAAALAGCGRSAGSVSGKVSYKGKPLSGGTVTFIGADDKVASAPIDGEGNYAIPRVAVGAAKVGIKPALAASAMPRGMKMDASKFGAPAGGGPTAGSDKPVALPDKYQDPNRSGVTCTVKAGTQDYNIDLK